MKTNGVCINEKKGVCLAAPCCVELITLSHTRVYKCAADTMETEW